MKMGNMKFMMKTAIKRGAAIVLAAAIFLALMVSDASEPRAYEHPAAPTIMRIGLYFGGSALPSANLMNARGYGEGFYFGYFDSNRQFVTLDSTNETSITMRPGTAARAINVVIRDTNTILFSFDGSGGRNLGVVPRQSGNAPTETWFRNNRYYGGFEYSRNGGNITVINVVDLEYYIKGVVPYEMSSAWPMEALKAQAVTARTFALYGMNRHRGQGFDLCNDQHCQVYRGCGGRATARTDAAVRETDGVIITHNGRPVGTFYASSNGGASESSENVWLHPYPHLRGVIDPFEAYVAHRIPGYNWTITFTPEQITQRLRNSGYNVGQIMSMRVSEYSPTGNVVAVTMRDANGTNWTFRRRGELIAALGVRSQRFDIGTQTWEGAADAIYINDDRVQIGGSVEAIGGDGAVHQVPSGALYALTGDGTVERIAPIGGGGSTSCNGMINGVFTIRGTGIGHNVGMSQWGAYAMARFHGMTYVDIIEFYYTGVTVGRIGT